MQLIMKPDGWPCKYEECRPGLFLYGENIGLKSEYGGDGFCDTGEAFAKRDAIVQPLTYSWEDCED